MTRTMRILNRYIFQSVIKPTLLVMFLLIALMSLFDFLDELNDVGTGNYHVGRAVLYVLLKVPFRIVELLPLSTLIGTVMGLGVMSSSSELTVMRAAGISPTRIGFAALRVALFLIVANMVVSEFVAPQATQYSERMRANSLSPNRYYLSGNGVWLRSGRQYINMEHVSEGKHAQNVQIFNFADDQTLRSLLTAKRANYQADGTWVLEEGASSIFANEQVQTSNFVSMNWQSDVSPDSLASLQVKPRDMTGRSLFYYVEYLVRNGLDWRSYGLEFWRKILAPLNIFAMVLAGIASVFGPLRGVTISARILTGVAVGMAFHFLGRIVGDISLASNIPPFFGALIPSTVFMMGALWLLRRAR